ncbi:hypothetical protein OHA77_21855 [Streptosporangium sp. NBC_01639]|uniref:hypothetical protein n=1 Tax=unclassified Streptosporangium TaxID=2632669 RepID=UPI002DDC2D1D|nr:hypothetical protein [Streptosporangium sp. NBC_01756]WSC90037.1 hypothetical protein OIE48_18195 [Streptosporangium sp. NBC_01756]WTD51338.1 hypothetical protein OHA77_21855 [Streptosporangium sp. NBC_01639]
MDDQSHFRPDDGGQAVAQPTIDRLREPEERLDDDRHDARHLAERTRKLGERLQQAQAVAKALIRANIP